MSGIKFFQNDAKTDIYIGTGAGTKLFDEIKAAKKSVKIISPYLSASYVDQLIKLKEKGLVVGLITSDFIEDYRDNRNKSSIVQQHQTILDSSKIHRDFLIKCKKWMIVSLSVIPLTFLIKLYFKLNLNSISLIYFSIAYIISILIIRQRIKTIRIYDYQYKWLFPIKIFLQPEQKYYGNNNSGYFIHSKIFIIDDEIAYLGSLNFTVSGFESNLETRFRTTDSVTIEGLKNLYNKLYFSQENPELYIEQIGKRIYKEPIN